MDISKHFPYPEIREQQQEAINFALKALLDDDKRFVIIEAGTGVGKSAVGYTVSRIVNEHLSEEESYKPGAWYVTTQKILQDQYVKDYAGRGMCSIKSASNYACSFKRGNTCADSRQELRVEPKGTKFWKTCTFSCVYKTAKESFLAAESSVTNFPYLLTEASYSGQITPRNMLVIDEAHNASSELSKFVEITITERFAKGQLKLTFPNMTTQFQALQWIENIYYPKLKSHKKHVEAMLEKYQGLQSKLKDFVTLSRQLQLLRSHYDKITQFLKIYSKENWVFDIVEGFGRKSTRIQFKPIDVAAYADPILFRLGRKVIMMSATILDKDGFCEMLGIDKNDAEFISLSSPFPVKNRPIFVCPIGRMSMKEIDATLPKLADAVKSILEQHKGEKGIIHAHSYKIANYLKRNIRSKRILIHDTDNRDTVLAKHIRSKEPTVLLSPSMTEGVDLVDETSRFQIVCKVPYPYLGDKLVRKKMNKWDWWYPLQTAKSVVQAVGRNVRSHEDFAVTYILDDDWHRFYKRNVRFFPEGFRNSIMR